jgi:hypothetical protein
MEAVLPVELGGEGIVRGQLTRDLVGELGIQAPLLPVPLQLLQLAVGVGGRRSSRSCAS